MIITDNLCLFLGSERVGEGHEWQMRKSVEESVRYVALMLVVVVEILRIFPPTGTWRFFVPLSHRHSQPVGIPRTQVRKRLGRLCVCSDNHQGRDAGNMLDPILGPVLLGGSSGSNSINLSPHTLLSIRHS